MDNNDKMTEGIVEYTEHIQKQREIGKIFCPHCKKSDDFYDVEDKELTGYDFNGGGNKRPWKKPYKRLYCRCDHTTTADVDLFEKCLSSGLLKITQ